MAFSNPTVARFKDYFDRAFIYTPDPLPEGADPLSYVRDKDIQIAIDEVADQINIGLFSTQKEYDTAFLNFAAHLMVMKLRADSQGVDASYPWLSNSKGIGTISEGYTIPEYIANNPHFSFLSSTSFGVKYVISVYGKTKGSIFTVMGGTKP